MAFLLDMTWCAIVVLVGYGIIRYLGSAGYGIIQGSSKMFRLNWVEILSLCYYLWYLGYYNSEKHILVTT